jgi:acetyltransferase-like isoleucine patch superfamily enzyme
VPLTTPLTVTFNNATTRDYNGVAFTGGTFTYSITPEEGVLTGLAYSGTSEGEKNAGTYSILGFYDPQTTYSITYMPGSVTISPKALTVKATDENKTYDGGTSITAKGMVASTLVSGDVVNSTGTQAYDNKNVGTDDKTVTASSVTIKDGDDVDMTGNYAITYVTNTASTIGQLALTVTATDENKTYDGGTSITAKGTVGTLVGTDVVNSTGTQAYDNKNVGTDDKTVTASSVTIKDDDDVDMTGNYAITYVTNTASTTTKALSITGVIALNKTYDGNDDVVIILDNSTIDGLVGDETLMFSDPTAKFDTADVGGSKEVTVTYTGLSNAGTGATAGSVDNYSLAMFAI